MGTAAAVPGERGIVNGDWLGIFSLLLNSIFSFMAGALVVFCTLKLFRVSASRWKMFLFGLPIAKILWDLQFGIPGNWLLGTGMDVLSLPPGSRMMSFMLGFSEFGPGLSFVLSAIDVFGNAYTFSFGDLVASWLMRNVSAGFPAYLMVGFFSVSALLLVRRGIGAVMHLKTALGLRQRGRVLRVVQLRFRDVHLFLDPGAGGTPYTGGVFRPYICFPEGSFKALSDDEREAVIQHELSHVRNWDLWKTMVVRVLGDVFWFVPGFRLLSRKIDRLREILADRGAVDSGVDPAQLASALLRMRERMPLREDQALPYPAFAKERPLLKERVLRLLGQAAEGAPRFGWGNPFGRVLITAWTTSAVLVTTLGGYARVSHVPSWMQSLVAGLASSMKDWIA